MVLGQKSLSNHGCRFHFLWNQKCCVIVNHNEIPFGILFQTSFFLFFINDLLINGIYELKFTFDEFSSELLLCDNLRRYFANHIER